MTERTKWDLVTIKGTTFIYTTLVNGDRLVHPVGTGLTLHEWATMVEEANHKALVGLMEAPSGG